MRRLAILFVVCLPALVVFAATAVAGPRAPHAQAAADDPAQVERGRELFLTSCSGCHGAEGGGTGDGPSLIGVGAAAADFQLSTGRMPLTDPSAQAVRKPPAFSPDEIDALVAYVASLGDGPPIPDVDPAAGDLAEGGTLFRLNCAACHSATGTGGALSYGDDAPKLWSATPLQIAEAIRTGPGQMPVFGPDTFTDHQVELDRPVRALPVRPRRPGRVLPGSHRPDHGRFGRAPHRDPGPAVRLPPHRGAA